jgi:DNA-binding NtrC family response regulator
MVLLVDDDADLLDVLGVVLDRAHISRVSAHSLAEVEALDGRLDDLTTAILDVNLGPDEPSGVEVAAWLRARHPDARIVFMTGQAPNHPWVRAATGAEGEVLAKPIDTKRLLGIARGTD